MWVGILVFGLFLDNVGLFNDNVGPRPLLFLNNVGRKTACSWVEGFLFLVRYT